MGRKKKGTKKTDENAGGDASAGKQDAPGPSTQPQAGLGGGDAPQSVEKSAGSQQEGQGPRQKRGKPQEQSEQSPADTQSQPPDQGTWQTKGPRQQPQGQIRASPDDTRSQQSGQGARQTRGPQQQTGQGALQTKGQQPQGQTRGPQQQPGQGAWQTKGQQQQPQGQTRGPQQQPGQGAWQSQGQQQQGQSRGPQQQPGQGAWQTQGQQQQGQSRGPQQQPGQGAWQSQGQQPQGQARGPQQQPGQGAWQSQGQQQQPQGQARGPQQQQPGQGAWQSQGQQQQGQSRGPQQQPSQGAWQTQGQQQQGQSRGPQQQPGQGAWQSQGQQPQGQARGPQQQPGQGAWQSQGQQGQSRGPQQQPAQGAWQSQGQQGQARGPQQQPGQGAWQSQGQQGQPRGPQQQPGQGAWQSQGQQGQTRGPQQQQGQDPMHTRGQQPQARGPQQHQPQPRDQQGHPSQEARPRQGQGAYPQQTHAPQASISQQQQSFAKGAAPQQRQSMSQSSARPATIIPEMEKMSLVQKGGGTKGRRIQVETNHLGIDFGKLLIAYHYDVQITPDTPKKWLRNVFEEFRKKHFPRNHPGFDGKKNMYSPCPLMNDHQEISDEIVLTMPQETKTKTYKVSVKLATTVDLSSLRDMRVSTNQQALQCVEIVLRSAPSKKCIQVGRSFFTKPQNTIIDLGEGCEMYYGHYQTVIRGWKPFFNVDVAHKAFPKRMNVVDLILELGSDYRTRMVPDDLKKAEIRKDLFNKLLKHIKGLRISYEIPGNPSSKREYKVNGLDLNPRNKIFTVENKSMSIEEYFKSKKNYRLYFPLLPTLWVGSTARTDRILLPAELCTVVEGQAINRKMTENQTSAMIKQAATSTQVRKDKIMRSLQSTNHNADACIREFGFTVNKEFERVEARVLDPPMLEYKDGTTCRVSKGVWRADNNRFLVAADLPSWIIISTCGNLAKECDNLAKMISSYGSRMGMRLSSRPGNFDCLTGWPLQKDVSNILQKYSKQYSLIFVVINDSGPMYSYVKKAAELTLNCLTQCIKKRTLMRMNPSTVGNILLKVNSKLNGTNHCLNSRPPILNQPCMIMGADVTHPSPDSRDIPSVAAVTASHDPRALFRYNMCCRLQLPTVEIIEDLKEITKEHLMYFFKANNGQKPYRIIFFRDGVSEGQFAEVRQTELAAIRKACSEIQQGYEPKITFIVVQKRHHTRFFPQAKDSEDRNCNVPAGTCVDTTITSLNMQDFYLVSHASIQGVAKPTKYSTIWDDNDMSYDDVEQLAYYLCHLFTRCNRSVSYPAPTYYAHLAAARAKVYIESEPINFQNLKNEQRKLKNDTIRKDKPMFFV